MAGMFTIGCKTCRLKGVRFTKRIMVAGRSFTKTWDERGIIESFPDSQEFLTKGAFIIYVWGGYEDFTGGSAIFIYNR
jgi:hypothetical protein